MPNCRVQASGGEEGLPEVARARPGLEAGQDQASALCGVQPAAFRGVGQGLVGGEAHSNGPSRDGPGIRTMCPGAKRRWT